jgi:hypothetical protein
MDMSGRRLSTKETVVMDTPALLATSLMVGWLAKSNPFYRGDAEITEKISLNRLPWIDFAFSAFSVPPR